MMVSGSNTVRAYMTPTSSNRAVVGLNPDSSASTPNTSVPPFLGLAFEIPFRPGPLVDAAPATPSPKADAPAQPAAVAAAPTSNVRRLNGSPIDPPSLPSCTTRRTHPSGPPSGFVHVSAPVA